MRHSRGDEELRDAESSDDRWVYSSDSDGSETRSFDIYDQRIQRSTFGHFLSRYY